jgi:hypothetical protein
MENGGTNNKKKEALAKSVVNKCDTGILPVFHGRDAHATRGFARASKGLVLLVAAVCVSAGLVFASIHALAQEDAEPADAPASRPASVYRTPATPLDMALKLERELARGAGVLMPDPERRVRLDGGVIPLDAAAPGFPAEFLAGLVPEEANGVEAWRALLCADDLSGDMLFYNAAGEPFWSVAADAGVWSADWIARLHSVDGTAADFFDTEERYHELLARPSRRMRTPDRIIYRSAWLSTRQYLLPSHVEMAFTFLLREDLDDYRSGGTAGTRSAAGAPSRSPAALTGLAFTGIASDTNGVALSAAWPAGTALAGGVLDIFFTPTLVPPAWTNPWRVALDPDDAGVDLLIPRADLPPPPEAPAPACVTNTAPSAYAPGVTHTNVICTNAVWLTDTGFFRLADAADTDGDGLTDASEKWVHGTRFDLADSDGDGMDDKWELDNLFDPLDPADAHGDPDGDGLPNVAEFRAGTDPRNPDSDGDGVPDGIEAAWWETAALPWFDASGGTTVLSGTNLNSGLIPAALPFPVRIGGAVCTNALLDINGVVYLIDRSRPVDGWIESQNYNRALTGTLTLSLRHFAVAAHWDNLYARTATPDAPATRITVADVTVDGARHCVIEYRDMGFYTNSSARVSFQVVIPADATNTVCVRYADTAGDNTGASATLGAQGPGAAINLPVSYDQPFITNSMTIAYHFGSGGSPLVRDTDGDGLEDGAELALGTSPANPDSDGDGLSDSLEAAGYRVVEWGAPYAGADAAPRPAWLLNVKEAAAAFFHTVAVRGDGTAVCWGRNNRGQCSPPPQATNIVSAAAGDEHSVALRADGTVVCWGGGGHYVLTPPDSATNVSAVTAGAYHTAALRADGTVVCWGQNYVHQCDVPAGLTNAVAVAAGFFHTAALTADGAVVCWGQNSARQCDVPPDLTNAVTVAAAGDHTAALTADGAVVCWGDGASGQNQVPPGLGPATLIGAGAHHTLACTGTGEVAAWGANGSGQAEGRSFTDGTVRYLGGGITFSLALVGGPQTFTDPLNADTDGDGLSDGDEVNVHGTDPLLKDTDGDGLPDGWEVDNGLNPLSASGDDGADGDPDDDGLTNLQEYQRGTKPRKRDTDGDGLSDGDEVNVHNTNPLDPDTDGDGLPDGWEVRYDFNPCVVQTDGTHGAADDPDDDGLTNLQEYQHGTDPFNEDTDDDGLEDGDEVNVHNTNPLLEDTDGDGLTDGDEVALKAVWPCLDPLVWDCDGDMLPDGWELQYGLSPCECAATNSPAWDADGDGLGLLDEYRYCTDPTNPDTDGDGVRDGDEVPHSPGSCPCDPDDEGNPANCVTLSLTVGDPSSSNSERWNFEVFEEITGRDVVRHCDDGFGTPGSAEYALVKGKAYIFSLRWIGTNLDEGHDFDWQALINDSARAGAREGLYGTGAFIVEDSYGLLTEERHGNEFDITIGETGRIIVPKIESVELVGAPPDGLVVKKGNNVTMKANILPDSYVPPAEEPKWYYQRLKADGLWEAWTSFGTSASGKTYTHTTTQSGVFRIKAVLSAEGTVSCEKVYERTSDEANGYGMAGDPDAFGVADTQMQVNIRNAAKGFLGNSDYEVSDVVPAQYGFPEVAAGANKCNIFVAHRAAQAGATVPLIGGYLGGDPPSANQWAGQDDTHPIFPPGVQTDIDHWILIPNPTYPQPGFIVGHPNPAGSGHVGIVDYDGQGIATGSLAGKIHKKYPAFLDGTSGFRKYEP